MDISSVLRELQLIDSKNLPGAKYYELLGVSPSATSQEITKGYRKAILKWHPDKNPHQTEYATSRFKAICEGYEVLQDPVKKQIFDEFGEWGLRVFRGEMPKKDPPVEKEIGIALEDLYCGNQKRFKITKMQLDIDGRTVQQTEKIITLNIKAGWRSGTKVKYFNEGDQFPGRIPGDIVIVLKERPHDRFKRDRNNLVLDQTVTVDEALKGHYSMKLLTLDSRVLNITIPEVITPNYEKIVPAEGMTISGTPFKGDLVIKFRLVFPENADEQTKKRIGVDIICHKITHNLPVTDLGRVTFG
mmetsp:Transcript_43386/g.109554  ORF Transcript_43386/g.109554 Transcript_43386/m.109554 type:complete len:301 (-) Transcript_43386:109-1011(-)|eukprot:CAMPEP_0177655408 /NCGR_PEP_ID=MMETSP0447-20121125/14951_1 /TAXON_ID=0 /ORGANISM="Stygamoeba regulata, Strain BSH-02190019" /LENGTH=300 /DNA_ID=CAMNT_0019159325 /DNA_START=102 /DNA_END=1004 /DNA_ORIENTATION=-